MKKLIYTLAAAAALTTMASCDDFLTEEIRGTENLDTYFGSADEVNSYVGGCYYEIAKVAVGGRSTTPGSSPT